VYAQIRRSLQASIRLASLREAPHEAAMSTTTIRLHEHLTGEGAKEIRTVLADARRKLVLIALRGGAIMAAHKALHPITIHCLEGSGALRIGDAAVELAPGTIVPLDAEVVHAVEGGPDLTLLVTMFRPSEAR
jgi:quercetin dioxygenase-like cupin family protein